MDATGLPGPSRARTRTIINDSSGDSDPSSHPASSILQERLQRTRQAGSNDKLPGLAPSAREHRLPTSTGSPGLPKRPKNGLPIRDTEQTLSMLHKQNFDLKLELFHRRQRQTALEERLDALEREKKERDEVNDQLVQELEKRDKAIEEAVAMIVALEERVEQLLRERPMAHQVDSAEPSCPRVNPTAEPTPSTPVKQQETKNLDRVPSFISDRSEAPSTPDTTTTGHLQLGSPALSILSDSSFGSIYDGGRTVDLQLPPSDSPLLLPTKAVKTAGSRRKAKARKTVSSEKRPARSNPTVTVSHHRRESTASSVCPWLQESLKPESTDTLNPMSSVSQQGNATAKNGRASPDLFSFPSSSTGWQPGDMFGSLGGTGYLGAGGMNPSTTPITDMLDAIGASVPGPSTAAPPAPNRRPSLLAKSSPASKPSSGGGNTRTRSNSIAGVSAPPRHLTQLGVKQDRAMTVPPKQVHVAPPPAAAPPKQRHYPPTTSRPRSRGLNSIFRRSIGSSSDASRPPQLVPGPPASAPPTEAAFKPPPSPHPVMGIPSWVRRASFSGSSGEELARASATPPPILRKKIESPGGGVAISGDEDGGVVLEGSSSWNGSDEGVPVGVVPGGSAGGGKRKWLGWGRVSSLRNRGAG
ncbi:hypothetical protein VTK26DRAFT_4049 [Humicola hyalothermophila]